MRVTLNLATARSPRERYALLWAVPVAVMALVGLAIFSASAVGSFRKYLERHRSVAERQELETQLRFREKALKAELDRPDLRELYRQARYVNALIESKHFSATELLEKVSKLLPAQVRLSGLALTQSDAGPVVKFNVVGGNEEALEAFLINLEESPDFSEVTIINQGFEQEGGAEGPVNISCTARYRAGGFR